jgi:hypothetical protein
MIRLAASDVAVLAAARTVEADGKFMLPASDTFLPKNPPIDLVFDLIEESVPGSHAHVNHTVSRAI